MIKTYKQSHNGELGTMCDIKGSRADVMNDFRAILSTCCEHPELFEILNNAISTCQKELNRTLQELKENDKDNISNND